ncbi:MAG TPA: hypothetical protein VJ729_10400 [Nitrososphaeraceae archaeon]|nr:hypothetical protein [Nitrososphaeraceae archaeon]
MKPRNYPLKHQTILNHYPIQYSLYATSVFGLRPTLIRLDYLMRIGARYAEPITNESFVFSYDVKRGLEIEFKPRGKHSR